MKLGKAIRAVRRRRNLQQQEVADTVGITPGYLSQIESDKREPNLSTLKSISEALNVPLPFLFWIALEVEDIPSQKQDLFVNILPIMNTLLDTLIFDDNSSSNPYRLS